MGFHAVLALATLAVACGGQSSHEGTPLVRSDDCVLDCGPTYEELFDPSTVATLRIDFGPEVTAEDTCQTVCVSEDVCETRCHPYDPPWINYLWSKWAHCPGGELVPARVTYERGDGRSNVTMQNVGVRLRGGLTRGANALPGMKLDFDVVPDEEDRIHGKRRFAGLNRMNLLSVEGAGIKVKESSLMIQCLAYGAVRAGGAPAPHCNHLNVVVNGKYYGLMQNVEPVSDRRFLRHAFDDEEGTLYEASNGCPPYRDSGARLEYSEDAGDAFVWPYSPVMVPADQSAPSAQYDVIESRPIAAGELGEAGAGNALAEVPSEKPADMRRDEWDVVSHPERSAHAEAELIPMLKCGDGDATPDDGDFKTCIRDWLDLDAWLRTLAAESLIPTLESFMVMRNYYLLFRADESAPHGGRFHLYSWDLDTAFYRQACYPNDCNPFTSVAGWWAPNQRAALAVRLQRVFKTEYCAHLNRYLAEAYHPDLVDRMADVLRPSIPLAAEGFLSPTGDPVVTPDDWEAEVARIRQFIVEHRETAQAQVDAECR